MKLPARVRRNWPWIVAGVVVLLAIGVLIGPLLGGVVGLFDKTLDLLGLAVSTPFGRLITFNVLAIVAMRWFASRHRDAWDRFFGGNAAGAARSLVEGELFGDELRAQQERDRLARVGADESTRRLVRAYDAALERRRSEREQRAHAPGRAHCLKAPASDPGAPIELLETTRSPIALAGCARWASDNGRPDLARAAAHEVLQQVPTAPDAIQVAVEVLGGLQPSETVDDSVLQRAIDAELADPLPVFPPRV